MTDICAVCGFARRATHHKLPRSKQTEHDFNLEKQMLVHNAKLRIQEEYTRKLKDHEIESRM